MHVTTGRLRENIAQSSLKTTLCNICLNKKLVQCSRSRRMSANATMFQGDDKENPTSRTGTKVNIFHPLFTSEAIRRVEKRKINN